MTKVAVNVKFRPFLRSAIDEARGDITRTRFIELLLDRDPKAWGAFDRAMGKEEAPLPVGEPPEATPEGKVAKFEEFVSGLVTRDGRRIELEPWQIEFVLNVFKRDDDGAPPWKRAAKKKPTEPDGDAPEPKVRKRAAKPAPEPEPEPEQPPLLPAQPKRAPRVGPVATGRLRNAE